MLGRQLEGNLLMHEIIKANKIIAFFETTIHHRWVYLQFPKVARH